MNPSPEPRQTAGGTLYVVATPIGNARDITLRALDVLAAADLVAAEDTRLTRQLLTLHQIKNQLVSYHEHNEAERTPFLIAKLLEGASIALASSAGTPTVSDPGYRLIQAAVARRIRVVPIPGVSAAITALSASGLPTDSFLFIGFLPKKKQKRRQFLENLAQEGRTIILYESPRRILSLLEELKSAWGDRYSVLGREMTKLHEEFIRGSLSQVHRLLAERPAIKGECTLLVSGPLPEDAAAGINPQTLKNEIRSYLREGEAKASEIAKHLAAKYRIPRHEAYELIMEVKDNEKHPPGRL